jgi:hypothetical protein
MTLAGRTGFSPVAADKGDFSLPGSTTRCWEEKPGADFLGADFLGGMGGSPLIRCPSYSGLRHQESFAASAHVTHALFVRTHSAAAALKGHPL